MLVSALSQSLAQKHEVEQSGNKASSSPKKLEPPSSFSWIKDAAFKGFNYLEKAADWSVKTIGEMRRFFPVVEEPDPMQLVDRFALPACAAFYFLNNDFLSQNDANSLASETATCSETALAITTNYPDIPINEAILDAGLTTCFLLFQCRVAKTLSKYLIDVPSWQVTVNTGPKAALAILKKKPKHVWKRLSVSIKDPLLSKEFLPLQLLQKGASIVGMLFNKNPAFFLNYQAVISYVSESYQTTVSYISKKEVSWHQLHWNTAWNKKFWMDAITDNPAIYDKAPPFLKEDYDIASTYMSHPQAVRKKLPKELQFDKDFWSQVIEKNVHKWKEIPANLLPIFLKNHEIATYYLVQEGASWHQLPFDVAFDKKFWHNAMKESITLYDKIPFGSKQPQADSRHTIRDYIWDKVPPSLKRDWDLATSYIASFPSGWWEKLPKELQSNNDFWLQVIQKDAFAWKDIPPNLRNGNWKEGFDVYLKLLSTSRNYKNSLPRHYKNIEYGGRDEVTQLQLEKAKIPSALYKKVLPRQIVYNEHFWLYVMNKRPDLLHKAPKHMDMVNRLISTRVDSENYRIAAAIVNRLISMPAYSENYGPCIYALQVLLSVPGFRFITAPLLDASSLHPLLDDSSLHKEKREAWRTTLHVIPTSPYGYTSPITPESKEFAHLKTS